MSYINDTELSIEDRKIFEDLIALEPGANIELNFQSKDGASSKRHIIYSWLKTNKLKPYYRVYWPTANKLVIKRLDTNIKSYSVNTNQLPEKLSTIFSALIKFGSTEEAQVYLREQKDNGFITPEELGILLCKYEEFMK